METGDGLLVRLRLTGGVLSTKNAHAIAACAIRYGSGLIDLSSRANLQLRGVSSETLQQAQELPKSGAKQRFPDQAKNFPDRPI